MKLVLCIILISFCTFNLIGQDILSMKFNLTASGRNISFCYSKILNTQNEFGAGIRININKIAQPDDQGNFFHKRLYASNFLQHLGLQIFYNRYLFKSLKCIKPLLFYDFQFTHSTTRSSFYTPYKYDTNGDVLYKNYIEYFGPFYWMEQTIGFGFKAKIFKSLFLEQKLGVTVMFILGEEEQLPQQRNFSSEFGYLFNVGFAYEIN